MPRFNRDVEFIPDEEIERSYDGEPQFTRLASEEAAGRPYQQRLVQEPYLDRVYFGLPYPERPGQ